MSHIEFFKLQAKNLLKDYQTKTLSSEGLYEYSPKYFNIDELVCAYDIDEDNFSLMKAQHIIAIMVGFKKWTDLSKASDAELELAKLLLDNRDEIPFEEWEMYIITAERDNKTTFDPETRLGIFKHVFLNEGDFEHPLPDFLKN